MNNFLATLCILSALLVLVSARGVLHVDTIYSSGDERIVIDNLLGDHAQITTLETHQIGFGTFDSLSVSAPGLDFSGSFLSISASDNVLFESTEGNINLHSAHNFEVNADLITLLANEVNVQTPGEIDFLSQHTILVNGNGIDITTGNGGVNIEATAGDLELSSVDAMTFDNWNLVLDTTGDVISTSAGDSVFIAEEEIVAYSESKLFLESSGSLSFVSSTDSVTFTGDYNTVATGSFNANGFDTASLESINNQISIFGYLGTLFQGDGITVRGETDGFDINVQGEDAGVFVTATNGDINLLTTSSSDSSEIRIESSQFVANVEEDLAITSVGETTLDATFEFRVTNDKFTANIDRDGFIHASGELQFTAGSTFGVNANTIYLKASDPGIPNKNDIGTIEITANEITHGVSGVSRTLYVSSNDLLMSAGVGGISFNARDTEWIADFTDARDQVAYLRAQTFDVSNSDILFDGGEISLVAPKATYTLTTDLSFKAIHEENSKVEFSAPNSVWNVRRWNHNAGIAAFAPATLSTSTQEILSFQSVDYTTGPYYDITGLFAKLAITTSDRFDLVAPRDITLATSELLSFTSSSSTLTSSSLSLNAASDALTVTSARDVFFTGQNAIVTTVRDEDSGDSLQYKFSNTVDISTGAFHMHGLLKTTMSSLGFVADASNIELLSGDFSDLLVTARDFVFDVASQMAIRGNSLTWDAKTALDVTGTSSITLTTFANGLDGYTKSDLQVYPSSALTINVYNELRLLSGTKTSFNTQTFSSTSSDDLWTHSDSGSVTYTASALNAQLNVLGNNITFATGDHTGDTFTIQTSQVSTYTASQSTFFDVSHGPLSFDSGSATVNTNAFEVHSGENVVFTTQLFTLTTDNGEAQFYGGSIDLSAPGAELSFISDDLLTINSTDTSIAGQVFDGIDDGLQFTAGSNVVYTNDAGGNMVFFSTEDLAISTNGAGSSGAITFSGTNVDVSSYLENQDISWSAGSTLSLTVTDDSSITSGGDFWINTKLAAKFAQLNGLVQINDDFQISAETGKFLINHLGERVLIKARSLSTATEDNFVLVNSTQYGSFDAGNGISFTSNGASASRREVDGGSNSESQFDSEVGFSVRSYDAFGDIVVQALQNKVVLNSGETSQFKSAAWLYVDTLFEQQYTAGTHTTFAEDGTVWYRGATGISIDAGRDLNFFASQYGNVYADQAVEVSSQDDFDLVSYHSNILLKSYERNNVLLNAGRDIDFTAAMGIDVVANGDISWTAKQEWFVQAARGFSLKTTEEGISFVSTSAGTTPNVVTSTEEIGVLAGGDLILGNAGVGGENMRFTGSSGVVFSTRAGNINVNTDTTTILGSVVEFNSIGSSSTNRDRVLFHAQGDYSASSSGSTYFEATELISLGEDNNRAVITVNGVGDVDIPGVEYNVAGNFEISSNQIFRTEADTFNLTTIAATSLTAGTTIDVQSTSGGISASAPSGVVSIRAGSDFSETGTTAVSSRSGELNLYYTGTADFDVSATFGATAAYYNNIVDGNYLLTSATTTNYQTTRPDGTISIGFDQALTFDAPTGRVQFSADQFIDFTIGADMTVNGNAGNTLVQISDDVPGHIRYDVNDFGITVTADSSFNGRRLDFLSPNLGSTIGLTSVDMTNAAGEDIRLSTNDAASYTATDTDYQIDDSFRVLSTGAISVIATTSESFETVSNEVRIQPGSGGTMHWAGTTFVHQGNPSLVTFQSDGGFFVPNTAVQVVLTATAGDVSFTSTERDADVSVIAGIPGTPGTFTFDSRILSSQSGDPTSNGDTYFTTPDLDVTGTNTLSFLTSAQDVATDSPINVQGGTITGNVGVLSYLSDTSVEGQEGQGTTQIVGTTSVSLNSGSDTMTFTAAESKITTEVRSATQWTAGADTMLFNTNGVNGGIRFDSDSFNFASVTSNLNVQAGKRAVLSVESDNFSSISLTYPTSTITAGATGSFADSTIQFRTEHETSEINLAFTALTTNADNLIVSSQIDTKFTAPILTLGAGNDASFIADGVFIDGSVGRQRTVGINFKSDGNTLIGTDITTTTVDFIAEDSFNLVSTLATTITATNTNIESVGDVFLDVQTVDGPIGSFTAHSGGITVAPQAGIALTSTATTRFDAGLYEDESQILLTTNRFVGAAGLSFASPITISLNSESNIQMKSKTSYTGTFTGPISMNSLKGDILYRSITLDTDGAQDGPFDLTIQSQRNDGLLGITFSAFYRFSHRQHLRLAMFDPATQPNRPGLPNANNNSAQQQPTDFFDWDIGLIYLDACICEFGDCPNVACPETTNRAYQMQQALYDMGLLYCRSTSDPQRPCP